MSTKSIRNLKHSAQPAAVMAAMVLSAAVLAASPGNAEASAFQSEQRRECKENGNRIEWAAQNYVRQGRNEAGALGSFLIAVAAPVVKNVVCDQVVASTEQTNPSPSKTKRF